MNKYQDALNHLIKCDRDSCSNISDAYRNDISALQELIRKSQQMPTDEKLNEICLMCDNYGSDVQCEMESSCKIAELIRENKALKEEINRLKLEMSYMVKPFAIMMQDLIYTEHFYRHAYHKDKTLLEWAIIWFKISNDDFYELYGFNFNPFDYPNLYEIARKIVHGKYA